MYCIAAHVPAMRDPGLRDVSEPSACWFARYAPGSSDARAGIQPAHPRRIEIVLEPAQLGITVHDDRVPLNASLNRLVSSTRGCGELRTLGANPY